MNRISCFWEGLTPSDIFQALSKIIKFVLLTGVQIDWPKLNKWIKIHVQRDLTLHLHVFHLWKSFKNYEFYFWFKKTSGLVRYFILLSLTPRFLLFVMTNWVFTSMVWSICWQSSKINYDNNKVQIGSYVAIFAVSILTYAL